MKTNLRYEHFKYVILRSLINESDKKTCELQKIFWEGDDDLNIDSFQDRFERAYRNLSS